MMEKSQYCLPRRRARHRDKIASYAVLLVIYIGMQIVASSTTSRPERRDTTHSHYHHTTEPTVDPTAVPTWRPRRDNCTPPAIEQFPRPIIGQSARVHGGLIIHILLAVYAFIGLAIVCDDYFVSSLDRICEEMKMSPDVAGATFMAAGSSAPELATVVIGVFIAEDDIGVSGVIGSAVFNIMFVISICALSTSTVCYLNWWPLCRDCFFYTLAILLMLFSIYNEKISWGESLMMLIMYVVYCVTLYFNPRLEQWAQTWPVPCRKIPDEQEGPVTYKTLDGAPSQQGLAESPDKVNFGAPDNGSGATGYPQGPPNQTFYKPKDSDPNEMSPLIKPEEGGTLTLVSWYVTFPIHYMCRLTLPDCKSEKYRHLYVLTFFLSMIWISFYSYIMVWMITVVGSTLGIPDTVMGLTFVAAGVSVPDALSSLAVVKEGYGDMAVSNAVGSNVFDILVCLGLPWFIQTAIIKPGSHVNVLSRGLVYSTLSLLSTVIFLIVATHLNGWKLDRKYGVILMLWYLFFITMASMYELNVFGYMSPPECPSNY